MPKVSKMDITFELLISKITNLRIYISLVMEKLKTSNLDSKQVNIIERLPLGTPPQAVVMTLAHNHVTNLFISSYREATVMKFGQ